MQGEWSLTVVHGNILLSLMAVHIFHRHITFNWSPFNDPVLLAEFLSIRQYFEYKNYNILGIQELHLKTIVLWDCYSKQMSLDYPPWFRRCLDCIMTEFTILLFLTWMACSIFSWQSGDGKYKLVHTIHVCL
jgi:hypothetical protein